MPRFHATSDVQSTKVGEGTSVWQNVVVFPDAIVGNDCNICAFCLLENDVCVGDRVTLKCGVYLWDGITIEDDVFIGPNVTFTNDRYPKSRAKEWKLERTIVKKCASIGANATILCGVTIGEGALIGAGSVVTKDVPANEVWVGNPAKFIRKNNS